METEEERRAKLEMMPYCIYLIFVYVKVMVRWCTCSMYVPRYAYMVVTWNACCDEWLSSY